MGEYAKYNGHEIKIGTCERMYYLRYEDRGKVAPLHGNVNPAIETGLFFRLPYSDEDNVRPGGYDNYNRGYRMYKKDEKYAVDYTDESLAENPGTIQLSHQSGLLLNVPCYHGIKLPEVTDGMKAFWNGKSWSIELVHLYVNDKREVLPVIHCRHCLKMWYCTWDEIIDYIHGTMKKRLLSYQIT